MPQSTRPLPPGYAAKQVLTILDRNPDGLYGDEISYRLPHFRWRTVMEALEDLVQMRWISRRPNGRYVRRAR